MERKREGERGRWRDRGFEERCNVRDAINWRNDSKIATPRNTGQTKEREEANTSSHMEGANAD
jgi:hypothetical protein